MKHRIDVPKDAFVGIGIVGGRQVSILTNGAEMFEEWKNRTGKKRKFIDAFENPSHSEHGPMHTIYTAV